MSDGSHKNAKTKVKVVVVGDRGVGKSCFIMSAVEKRSSEGLYPMMHDIRSIDCAYGGKSFCISFWDTAAGEYYDCVRPRSYDQADLIILCYSAESRYSFKSAQTTWIAELRQHCPHVPIILMCTKIDLRSPPISSSHDATGSPSWISRKEGAELASTMGAVEYMECSSLEQTGDLASVETELAHLATAWPKTAPARGGACALL